jgi:thiol-disulfide isomerase/thioredoxin
VTGSVRGLVCQDLLAEALGDVRQRHLDDEGLVGELFLWLQNPWSTGPAGTQLLRTALERSKSRRVRSHVCLCLARSLRAWSEGAQALRLLPEKARAEHRSRIEETDGAEFLQHLEAIDPNQLTREAGLLYERVVREYADVPYAPYVGPRTLAEAAQAELLALRDVALGQMAPEIEGEDLAGKRLRLSDYRGRVVVVVFWGFWCGPCRAQIPHERALVRRVEGKPFSLLGVNSDADREQAKERAKKEGMTWPSWWDRGADGPIVRRWAVTGWPAVYVLDHRGVLRHKGVTGKDLDDAVDTLLRELGREKGPASPDRAGP